MGDSLGHGFHEIHHGVMAREAVAQIVAKDVRRLRNEHLSMRGERDKTWQAQDSEEQGASHIAGKCTKEEGVLHASNIAREFPECVFARKPMPPRRQNIM
jgi:hypothetical protein